jgi:hypothetical protein|uniref:Uncharacterized protein n=1 Tax=Zea mays TaxID=4577 RepID=C0P2V5_MAIZE|nr:unknown [Zea mays]
MHPVVPPVAWLGFRQPTRCRRTFLAVAALGGDLRGTNTAERSCGTGKKARAQQQRFLLLSGGGAAGLAGFRGAGGHTVAGRSRQGDAAGVTQAAAAASVLSRAPQPPSRRGIGISRELEAVGVTQPVSAASGPSSASSPGGRAAAAVWIGRSTANSERSSSWTPPIGRIV